MCRATVWLAVLAWCICGDGGVYANRKLTCDSDHTLMKSFFAYENPGRTCRELIADVPNHYNPFFIDDCKRWMGDDHKESVDDYFVTHCDELSDGTLKYKADVCCSGPTVMRCFECDDNSAFRCRQFASAVQCSEGQVCQTTVNFHGFYPETAISRTTGCADASVCQNAQINNKNACKDWLTDPECNSCCDTPYCNYYNPSEPDLYVGDSPCLSEPCQNGATCEYEPNEERTYTCKCTPEYAGTHCTVCAVDPCNPMNPCENGGVCVSECTSYQCQCRVGWTGDLCVQPQPFCAAGIAFCENGGTCYDHGSHGLRCKCPEQFVGEHCEITKVECSVPMAYRRATQLKVKRSTDCTEAFLKEAPRLYDENSLELCANYMTRQFGNRKYINNVDGEVTMFESRGMHECDTGDMFTFSRTSWCCPSCHSMPCHNNGWCTQTEDNNYHCQCRHGWFGTHCERRRNSCVITGDPHYLTFDDLQVHFQGGGNYKLVSSKQNADVDFEVTSKNEKVGLVSYLYSISISACDHLLELQRDQIVLVDGEKKDPAAYLQFDCIHLTIDGNQVKVETSYGLVVEFDGAHTGIIDLPIDLMGKVHGLCGDFDSETDNDWIAQDGTDLINDPDRHYHLGASWEIGESMGTEVSPTLDCSDITNVIESDEYCGHLLNVYGIFEECMADEAVNHVTDAESCNYDVCANKLHGETAMKAAACDAMQTLVLKCEAAGHIIFTWRDITGCPLICKEGFEYCDSAPACPATCRMPNAPENCDLSYKEACVCPEGTLLKNGECISPADCGCIDDHGNEFEVDDTWRSEDCESQFTCTEGVDMPSIVPMEQSCQEGTICSSTKGGIGQCIDYTNPCDDEPCFNDGICETIGLNYSCRCRAGFNGERCRGERSLCDEGTEYCENGGICYNHNWYGLRCKCPIGFVGTKCEIPALNCSAPGVYRVGGFYYKEGQDCTKQLRKIERRLNAESGLHWCKKFMSKRSGRREFNDTVDGRVTMAESRSFSSCEMGDTHMFATNDWCCPSCYSLPCLNGGSCNQEPRGEYTCECVGGWSGANCEIEPESVIP